MFHHDFNIALSWEDKFQNKILLTYQISRMDYFVKIDNCFLIMKYIIEVQKKYYVFFQEVSSKVNPVEGQEKLFLHFCRIIFVHFVDEVGRFCCLKTITDFIGSFLLLFYKLHCNTFNVMTINYVNVSGMTDFIKVNFLFWSIFAGSHKFLFRICKRIEKLKHFIRPKITDILQLVLPTSYFFESLYLYILKDIDLVFNHISAKFV